MGITSTDRPLFQRLSAVPDSVNLRPSAVRDHAQLDSASFYRDHAQFDSASTVRDNAQFDSASAVRDNAHLDSSIFQAADVNLFVGI